MVPLPPLNLNATSSADSAWDQRGSASSAFGGDFNVNIGGSGQATQTASSLPSLPSLSLGGQGVSMIWIAVAVGVAWYILKK